jgi:diaminohydroxyphosphoribosylaminopyrimidine deaminase/5-amino-6-(5-phosphoribosylamino)uracil reductase
MRLALAEAERGRGWVEPNPLVGALVVRDGQLVAAGHHGRFGGPHAEVVALDRAGEAARGATLYVSLEPCCHHGKTPPCVEAIVRAGVGRVVAAMVDPDPRVTGGGLRRLREAGIEAEVGLEEELARELNAAYLKRLATGRPYVIAKWAMTLDGKTATASGESRWISNERSRMHVHALRGRVDAIVVGVGTVWADDPRLTARPAGPRVASRVILDSQARLPLESRLVATVTEAPVVVAVTKRAERDRVEALRSRGCEVVELEEQGGRVSVGAVLEELGRRGMTNVLVEGGGRVLGSFFDAGEVDEVEVYVAPRVEGGDHAQTGVRGAGSRTMAEAWALESVRIDELDGDVRLRGVLDRWWRRGDRAGEPA